MGDYPPFPPSLESRHFLGTDTVGRDILARLVYGFRIAIFFSLGLLLVNYTIGVSIGSAMGYWGGKFDLIFQRIIEIWSNVPFLYVIIIISSIVVPSFFMLILIMAVFGWIGMTWTMRTVTYKEKASGIRPGGQGPGGFGRTHHLPAHHPQHHRRHRHLRAVFGVRRHRGPDLPGLSRVRPAAAHPQLGGAAAAGVGEPGCLVDRRVGGRWP